MVPSTVHRTHPVDTWCLAQLTHLVDSSARRVHSCAGEAAVVPEHDPEGQVEAAVRERHGPPGNCTRGDVQGMEKVRASAM